MKTKYKIFVVFFILLFASMNAQLNFFKNEKVAKLKIYKSAEQAHQDGGIILALQLNIKDGWHVNSNKPHDEFLIPIQISVTTDFNKEKNEIIFPKPEDIKLEFSEEPVSVFEGNPVFGSVVKIPKDVELGNKNIVVKVTYQACNDKTCMPPETIIDTISFDVVAGSIAIKENKNDIFGKINFEKIDNSKKESVTTPIKSDEEPIGIWIALLSAFLGGIILNLMPCVLPVLSLKILGIVQQSGEDSKKRINHGIAFTLGVVSSFLILAGILLLLRAGGEQLGWGFQLQSPAFIILLTILLFLFGLSMFGVFEIGTSLTAVGQSSSNDTGFVGSFSSGILATVVATPCTAPFMGSALGFALSQPTVLALLIFAMLGLGMALPYLLLTTVPALVKYVPRPGAWMESFKQFMGFLLMATVLWLLWVFSLQVGAEGLLILLAAFIIVSIGGWIFGRWGNIAKPKPTRVKAMILTALFIIGGVVFAFKFIDTNVTVNQSLEKGNIKWQKFTPDLLSNSLKEGKPVFIDFTAAWCLSCQVNEKVAFGSEDVQKAFKKLGVVMLKADWTNSDAMITKELAKFGRNSVPLYVLYSGKENEEPQILPEIITPGIVIDALKKIGGF